MIEICIEVRLGSIPRKMKIYFPTIENSCQKWLFSTSNGYFRNSYGKLQKLILLVIFDQMTYFGKKSCNDKNVKLCNDTYCIRSNLSVCNDYYLFVV